MKLVLEGLQDFIRVLDIIWGAMNYLFGFIVIPALIITAMVWLFGLVGDLFRKIN